jgi:hypothetical protein
MPCPRVVSIVALSAALSQTAAQPGPPAASLRAPFEFHSSVWVNLHHFLYLTARGRKGLDASRSGVVAALADTVGFGALSSDQRGAWDAALAYYGRALADRDILFDSSMVRVTNELARIDDAPSLGGARLDSALLATLERAMPAYRALWWARHDASNRRWIVAATAMVAEHGDSAVQRESRAFRTPWSAKPVRVDVAAYTNWAGAYTTEHPSHINISSTNTGNQGSYVFETLFHEVLHTMEDSVFAALRSAFRDSGKRSFRDPTHPFIFYTAGEVTRRAYPDHVPYAERFGLWAGNADFVRALPLLRAHWQPYLDGKITLEESMRRFAGAW